MMTPDDLRAIMTYLRDRVHIGPPGHGRPLAVAFRAPAEAEMIAAGLNADGVRRLLRVPWWEDMVADIEETPEVCDPADPPEQVLEYARDVVSEYIRKRFPLE